jgi:hypothetical protein
LKDTSSITVFAGGAVFAGLGISTGIVIFEAQETLLSFVIQFQTLIAGIIAAMAAAATIHFIRKQINLEQNFRQRSARAGLAINLSAITKYASESMKLAKKLRDEIVIREREDQEIESIERDIEGYDESDSVPVLSKDVIEGMTYAAGALPDPQSSQITDLLTSFQVQYVNLVDLKFRIDTPVEGNMTHAVHALNGESAINQAAALYSKASELFNFARATTVELDDIPTDKIATARRLVLYE